MTQVWFGVMPFGSQVDEKTAHAMVKRCLDAGVTRFDTADAYNWGTSEEFLGRALKGVKDVTIATKVGARYGKAPAESGLSPDWIRKSIDGSLERLGVESVEVYYMHQPDPGIPIDDTLSAFEGIMKAGKVKEMGISNYAAWQVMEMISKGHKPAIAQQMLNLIARGLEQEYLPFAEHSGIPTLAYNPLAGGMLTGKHKRDTPPAEGTRFHENEMYQKRFWRDQMFNAVELLSDVAKKAGKTLVELSLQWVCGRVDGVLLGATNLDQLNANLKALDGTLDDQTVEACDCIWSSLKGPIPNYNR